MIQQIKYPLKMWLKQSIPEQYHPSLRLAYETPKNIWFHLQNKTLTHPLIIVLGSAHRVGSNWLYRLLRDTGHCRFGINRIPAAYRRFGTICLEPEMYDCLRRLRGHFIFKSHSLPPGSAEQAGAAKFISIYRDPRDVLVSASFFFAHLEEEKGGLGSAFRALSPAGRIKQLINEDRPDNLLKIEQWFRTPYAYQVSYEALQQQPVETLQGIAAYLEIPITVQAIEKVVWKHDFEAKSGRKPGQAQEDHAMRKGISGDWRNYFDPGCIAAFKTGQAGRWNRLLVAMGYESSLEWE